MSVSFRLFAQVTANPDDETAVGVKVMMLMWSSFMLHVKLTTNPIAVALESTGLAGPNVIPEPSKTPVRFVVHVRFRVEKQKHLLC